MSMLDLNLLSSYQFNLPKELIAQHPCEPRDGSRLMIVNKKEQSITTTTFRSLTDLLQKGDSLVFNNTRVIPARLMGKRKNGGHAEIFLLNRYQNGSWNALVRPGRKLLPGTIVEFAPSFSCEILEALPNGGRHIQFICDGDIDEMLEKCGQIPLPTYIDRQPSKEDANRYQTVYASIPGAVAAPTAGLHFTEEMIKTLELKGVSNSKVTLHTGLGTFRPVQTDDIRAHLMHSERCLISTSVANQLNARNDQLQICVGTTTSRALEAAATSQGLIEPGDFNANIFIYPGYQFKYVKNILTNFHLPGSTLLMLVCTLGGHGLIMEAYERAIKEKFRFYSYGDAMLILG